MLFVFFNCWRMIGAVIPLPPFLWCALAEFHKNAVELLHTAKTTIERHRHGSSIPLLQHPAGRFDPHFLDNLEHGMANFFAEDPGKIAFRCGCGLRHIIQADRL